MNTVAKSLNSGNKTDALNDSRSTRWTSETLTVDALQCIEAWLTSLRPASPASHSAQPGRCSEKTIRAINGLKPSAAFASWDRDTSCWRTIQASLLSDTSDEYSETYPRAGIASDGMLYQQKPVAPRIYGNGSGLSGQWPTPLARDWKDTPGMLLEGVNPDGTHRDRTDTLPRAVWSRAKHPTPRAQEGGPDFAKLERGILAGQSVSPSLATAVCLEAGEVGPLNPQFREWLMGWPIDWSAKKPLETDRFREWLEQHGDY